MKNHKIAGFLRYIQNDKLCLSKRAEEVLINRISFFLLRMTCLLILLYYPINAQSIDWENYGYAKYMFSISETDSSKNGAIDHQIHVRLNNRIYFQEYFTTGLELRLRGFQGSSVENKNLSPATTITPYEYDDLDALFWEKSSHFAYGQIDRLFLDYSKDDWQVTVGRQRIAWGTSMVWNIVDLFNPQSILDFDYEELPGSDALRVQYFTDAIGRLEMVYKPSHNNTYRSLAFLYLINQWDYDFYFLGALHNDKPTLGTAFTGDIEGAGFRGEFKTSKSQSDKHYFSTVLSIDYTYLNSLYLHGELLFNSIGKENNSTLYALQAQQDGLLSPAKKSLFLEAAYELHPLVRGGIFVLINPDEKSSILAPSLSWSVISNLDVYLIGLLSFGSDDSEFARLGKAVFIRTKYSF